jgi:hypothetical protein
MAKPSDGGFKDFLSADLIRIIIYKIAGFSIDNRKKSDYLSLITHFFLLKYLL